MDGGGFLMRKMVPDSPDPDLQLFINLFICLFIHPSIHLSIHLSVQRTGWVPFCTNFCIPYTPSPLLLGWCKSNCGFTLLNVAV